MEAHHLTERDRRILAALVREYIDRGEPVSSLWLTRAGRFDVSSATLRNVFARLEEMGFLKQPHASAGRIPTDLGYRFFVDQLLQQRKPSGPALDVEARLRDAGTVDDMLANASQELSRLSHHVGFVLMPSTEIATLQQIDFVPLAGSKVLVVVIARGGHISHKVVDVGETLGTDDLRQAANYLNAEFAGLTLAEIRALVEDQLAQERTLYDTLMARALRLASCTLDEMEPRDQVFIQGASSLLADAREEEAGQLLAPLRALLRMIEEKHRLVKLLSEYIDGPGLTVVIGTEHNVAELRTFSLVASTYNDGRRTGTVGVIGPTRMRYSRAIAAVDGMAGALNRTLRSSAEH